MKEFFDLLARYNEAFVSSESPLSFLAVIDSTTMIDLMNKALAVGDELVFEYAEQEGETNPDNLIVKIYDEIVFG
jgi:hypothetical protein